MDGLACFQTVEKTTATEDVKSNRASGCKKSAQKSSGGNFGTKVDQLGANSLMEDMNTFI
jgi:hypothetical protein